MKAKVTKDYKKTVKKIFDRFFIYVAFYSTSTTYPTKQRKYVATRSRSGSRVPSGILPGSTSTVPECRAYGRR